MREALGVLGDAFSGTSRRLWGMGVANVTAILLSLPGAAVLTLVLLATRMPDTLALVAIAVAVLPNPFAAGLQFIANESARGEGIFLSDMWDGLRRYFLLALKGWLLSVGGTMVIFANLRFYPSLQGPLGVVVEVFWFYVLVVWLAMHLYVYPLLMEQRVKRLVLIYRNAFVMTATRPLFSIVVAVAWLFILLLASLTGLIAVVGLALGACIQHNAAITLMRSMRHVDTEAEV
jgi:uncharacterized membrane protein YesL